MWSIVRNTFRWIADQETSQIGWLIFFAIIFFIIIMTFVTQASADFKPSSSCFSGWSSLFSKCHPFVQVRYIGEFPY